MKRNNKKGFTIVELVIVIAVIAILSAVLIPTFGGIVEKAQKSAAEQEVKNAYTATIAEELSTPDTTDDVVYGNEVIVNHDGFLVKVSASGVATVVESGTAGFEINDEGLLEAITANP